MATCGVGESLDASNPRRTRSEKGKAQVDRIQVTRRLSPEFSGQIRDDRGFAGADVAVYGNAHARILVHTPDATVFTKE